MQTNSKMVQKLIFRINSSNSINCLINLFFQIIIKMHKKIYKINLLNKILILYKIKVNRNKNIILFTNKYVSIIHNN